jgi:hypothetical protein
MWASSISRMQRDGCDPSRPAKTRWPEPFRRPVSRRIDPSGHHAFSGEMPRIIDGVRGPAHRRLTDSSGQSGIEDIGDGHCPARPLLWTDPPADPGRSRDPARPWSSIGRLFTPRPGTPDRHVDLRDREGRLVLEDSILRSRSEWIPRNLPIGSLPGDFSQCIDTFGCLH